MNDDIRIKCENLLLPPTLEPPALPKQLVDNSNGNTICHISILLDSRIIASFHRGGKREKLKKFLSLSCCFLRKFGQIKYVHLGGGIIDQFTIHLSQTIGLSLKVSVCDLFITTKKSSINRLLMNKLNPKSYREEKTL